MSHIIEDESVLSVFIGQLLVVRFWLRSGPFFGLPASAKDAGVV